jgi:RHS repeat-associated protein
MVKVSQGVQNRYFLYDFLGRLIRVRQPEQEVNTALDKTDLVTNNNQWTAAMEYDLIGNLKKTTDAEGKQITNDYDKAGRVTKRSYSNADTPTVFYYYDGLGLSTPPPTTGNFAKGKLTKVMSSISTTQYTAFDNFGRTLTSEQITDGQTYESKYKYDFGGRLVDQTYPSGKVVRNFFESDGDLARITGQGKVYASDFSYTSTGVIEKLKLGNGLWESAKLNERQQVEEIKLGTSPTDGSKWQVNYKYGELQDDGSVNTAKNTGNIAKQTINFAGLANPFVQTYKYDGLDRLVEAKEVSGTAANAPQTWKQTFNYDRFGNRNAFSQVVGTATLAINNQTLPSINQLTNRFNLGQGFEYDKSGNIIKDSSNGQVRNFIFNGDNKQVHVKNAANENIGTYYYDGNGSRVKKVTQSETTIFAYDGGGKLVAEYSTQQNSNPTVSYTATDTLGSPRVITDKNGNVISRRDFMPFGEELNANTATNRLETAKYNYGDDGIRKRFTGYEKDQETGLDFAEARYYNNQHGRFTAVDPLLASGQSTDPQSFNRFVYVMNRPMSLTDPTGLQAGTTLENQVNETVDALPPEPDSAPDKKASWWQRNIVQPINNFMGGFMRQFKSAETNGRPEESQKTLGNKGSKVNDVMNTVNDEMMTKANNAMDILDVTGQVSLAKTITDQQKGKATKTSVVVGTIVAITSSIPGAPIVGKTIPKVANAKLANLVKDLFKGAKTQNPIGTGSTADAVRNEILTGLPTAGKFHSQKAREYITALEKWMQKNAGADHRDKMVAQSLLDDLRSALGGN